MQRTTLISIFFYAFLFIFTGCGGSDGGDDSSNIGTDNNAASLPEATVINLDSGGELSRNFIDSPNGQREYSLFSPDNPERKKLPLVIWLHGARGVVWPSIRGEFWIGLAREEQFHLLAPQALTDSLLPYTYWNAGFLGSSLSDGLFINTVLEAVVDNKEVDTDRIYIAGMSSGAHMVFLMARGLLDKVAAVAPISGLIPSDVFPNYSLARPMPLCYIYGTKDTVVPEEGNDYLEPWSNILSFWLDNNGIASDATITQLPDITTMDNSTVTKLEYRGAGLASDITIYRINNGTHSVPGFQNTANFDINAYQVIWDFFKQHKLTDPY